MIIKKLIAMTTGQQIHGQSLVSVLLTAYLSSPKYTAMTVQWRLCALPPSWIVKSGLVGLLQLSKLEIRL